MTTLSAMVRRTATVKIKAHSHTLTAADPSSDDLRDAFLKIRADILGRA